MKAEYDFSRGKRGAVLSSRGKTRITIYLDDEIVKAFKAESERTGKGYQTLINESLAQHARVAEKPVTAAQMREILQEVLAHREGNSLQARPIASGDDAAREVRDAAPLKYKPEKAAAVSERITLHGEIQSILRAAGTKWMLPAEIADAVNRRGRYHRRDGTPVPASQINARVAKHHEIFECRPRRGGLQIGLRRDFRKE